MDGLARHMTKQSHEIHRASILHAFIDDTVDTCHAVVFSHAGFEAEISTKKPASESYIVVAEPNTWAPLAGLRKSQDAISHSPTDSEILAGDVVLKSEGRRSCPAGLVRGLGRCRLRQHPLLRLGGGDRKIGNKSAMPEAQGFIGKAAKGLNLKDIRCVTGAKAKELTEVPHNILKSPRRFRSGPTNGVWRGALLSSPFGIATRSCRGPPGGIPHGRRFPRAKLKCARW